MSTGGVGDGGKGAEDPSEQGAPRATAQGVGDRPRRRRGAESIVVPDADFQSYYGRQVIHTPVWEVPQVPGYLYLGGMSGAASVMGALADATGRPALAKVGRLAASGGSIVSVVLLIDDLGVPTRFLNMLRVVKWTSPLSVGSWILMPFSTGAGLAAVHELSGVVLPLVRKVAGQRLGHLAEVVLPVAGRVGGVGSALFGPPLATYTAVLIADTAVPAWHSVYPSSRSSSPPRAPRARAASG
ncbi:MAG: polysulfide reductase NrfD [Quadrisphaera sp.]